MEQKNVDDRFKIRLHGLLVIQSTSWEILALLDSKVRTRSMRLSIARPTNFNPPGISRTMGRTVKKIKDMDLWSSEGAIE